MSASLVGWEYWLNTWPDHPIALTRANAADGYPKALTPLSQDLILTYEEQGVRRFYFEGLGVLTEADAPDPYLQAFYGLVYLNADQIRREGAAAALDAEDPAAAVRSAGPAGAAALDDVIDRYGHHAAAELELANPSWREDPRPVLETVRVELRREETPDQGALVRARAEAELIERLGSVKRRLVTPLLRRSQGLMAMRENGKIPVVLLWDELRRILAAAGLRLVERGVLPSAAHVFSLRHAEFHGVLAGDAGPRIAEVERRHEAHQRCLGLNLPELVEVGPGGIRPLDDAFIREQGLLPPEKVAADATLLHGIAAAPGTITGRARVLTDPNDSFDPGDVLFARKVDPGWAPVLACAGAVVLDIGGVLSHGAVVARELGIPCVVNVKVHRAGGERLHGHRRRLGRRGQAGVVTPPENG